MVAESSREVADSSLSVTRYIGNLSDVIEHMPASEEKDCNQTEGCPKVPVLQDGNNIRSGDREERDGTEDSRGDGNNLDIVDRSVDGRLGYTVGKLTGDPSMNLFGGLRTDLILAHSSLLRFPSSLTRS